MGGGSRRFDSFLDIYDVMVRKGKQETNASKHELTIIHVYHPALP